MRTVRVVPLLTYSICVKLIDLHERQVQLRRVCGALSSASLYLKPGLSSTSKLAKVCKRSNPQYNHSSHAINSTADGYRSISSLDTRITIKTFCYIFSSQSTLQLQHVGWIG